MLRLPSSTRGLSRYCDRKGAAFEDLLNQNYDTYTNLQNSYKHNVNTVNTVNNVNNENNENIISASNDKIVEDSPKSFKPIRLMRPKRLATLFDLNRKDFAAYLNNHTDEYINDQKR